MTDPSSSTGALAKRSSLPPANTRSPALKAQAPGDLPNPLPACADCPAGSWYKMPTRLKCFCEAFRDIVWSPGLEPVLMGDAHQYALAKAQEE